MKGRPAVKPSARRTSICGRLDATLGGGKRANWKKKRMRIIDRRRRLERMRLAEIEGGEREEHG